MTITDRRGTLETLETRDLLALRRHCVLQPGDRLHQSNHQRLQIGGRQTVKIDSGQHPQSESETRAFVNPPGPPFCPY